MKSEKGYYRVERTYPEDGMRAGAWRGMATGEKDAQTKAANIDSAGPRYETGTVEFLGDEPQTREEVRDFIRRLKPINFDLSR